MNEYERIALDTRKKVSKLTLDQQRELLKLYENSIDNLASKATSANDKTLTKRWLLDYNKEILSAKKNLAQEIEQSIKGVTTKAAAIGTETERKILTKMFSEAGIDPGNHFSTMFSQVQNGVIEDIISGNLYKDKRTMSQRIWNHTGNFEKDIQYIINQAILEKKSAIELAKDLEKFVRAPARRESTWGKAYPQLMNKKVDYNAQRLARTSINHAYQTASIKSNSMNPFNEGIKWRSAEIHGRTCELCIERANTDQFGLGVGIFPADEVPLDHANGLCTMLPHITKSLDEVADELRDWLNGKNNTDLDEWYDEHGEHFAFKKLGDSYNTSNRGIINDIIDTKTLGGDNPFIKIYENWDKTNIKEFATKLVEHEELPFKVNRHILSGSHGQCKMKHINPKMEVLTYELNSKDLRDVEYQVKTAFHELFHAKSNGLVHDVDKIKFINWAYVDDVFAEVTSHYLTKSVGITKEITPSYPGHLIDALPKLKKLPEFSSCKTIADFGEVAYKYRFSENPNAEWKTILDTLNSTDHDIIGYSKQYLGYIEKNKNELVDKLLENMPQYSAYKKDIVNNIDDAVDSINNGYILRGNEKTIFENTLIITMNRLGVK